jgi:hypothetical protein
LHLALETAQCIFQRLTFLDNDFSHFYIHPQSGSDWLRAASLLGSNTAPVIIARQPPCGHAHRNGSELMVSTERPAKICPMDCILTCAPLHGLESP